MRIKLFGQTTNLRPDVVQNQRYEDMEFTFPTSFEANQYFGQYTPTHQEILEWIFNSCNGHGNIDLEHLWYHYGTGRSMSVMDIVVIDNTIYRCESAGWSKLENAIMTHISERDFWKLNFPEPLAPWEKELLDNAPAAINVPPILVGLLKGIDPRHVTDEELLARVRNELERRMRESGQLSKIQQIKEIRSAAKKLADVPANDWARPSISNNGIGENGYTRVHVSNPSHGLKYVKELVMELDRAGYELRRKTK